MNSGKTLLKEKGIMESDSCEMLAARRRDHLRQTVFEVTGIHPITVCPEQGLFVNFHF
ncbi:hypothetical protein KSU1_D0091 [Candidatus Jettenia caeni]|uniref:Uncharacterized protein n=1 Tax=Candidatus Jettenia caeni TaxID=247490 RepID=I3INV5_9BACT|nr:hypothetical protein [Candidatus Jettenia sp. AMX1]WKZ15859.1 MAG: hypothetical protein QY317_00865 [Candidatus Jettenia caeni]GAB63400.1 hypothetical protein KSU1_D0091 [Candidatus Jettenia caeni]GIL20976.1 MAG: hypothetical protein BroJett041_20900 [Candidatus Jettenia caeni]GJQ44470.1 MAG: hypothetical protein JETCAE04_02240 [Candidatus Jettenia caeni]